MAPKPSSGSELELTTFDSGAKDPASSKHAFDSGAKDPASSKHAQAPRAQGVNLGKLNSYMHHPDHYL